MTKRTPKAVMEEEAGNLIRVVTDIQEDEENFEICERFVLSNLFYHKFLDPDERKVKKSLAGLELKFRVHSQVEKADMLNNLVEKYNRGEIWEEHHEQFDVRYRLMAVLLNLSESPVNQDYSPPDSPLEEKEEVVDWMALLREGEYEIENLGEEESLSDWSETEEEEVQKEPEENILSDISFSTELEQLEEDHHNVSLERISSSESWIRDNIQRSYWDTGQNEDEYVDSVHLAANLSTRVEQFLLDQGQLGVNSVKISEYKVIRELLWMLRCPTSGPLFQINEDEFVLTRLITIPSLTQESFRHFMKQILIAINNVHHLKLFLKRQEIDSDKQPRTLLAYASSIENFFESFSTDLFQIESDIKKQNEIHTLFTFCDTLTPWFRKLSHLRNLHDQAMGTGENWLKSIRLLSVVYNYLFRNIDPDLLPFLLEIFLRSFKPYLNIINKWLTEGRLEDWRREFIFFKEDNVVEDEEFWIKMFKHEDYQKHLKEEGILPLRLLDGLDSKIFVSGKSIEILANLDQKLKVTISSEYKVVDEEKENDFFTSFISNLEELLPRKHSAELAELTPEIPLGLKAIACSADDPHLVLAMQEAFKGFSLQTEVRNKTSEILTNSIVDPLLPLDSMMKRCLTPFIMKQYTKSCSALVSVFRQDLELELVLSRARKVFFMEAGDLMHDFCSQLFSQLDSDQQQLTDSVSLTLLLKDCLSARYYSWSHMFSVSWSQDLSTSSPVPSLSGLTIHLTVPWPLNVLLTSHNLSIYNKVFVFLAGVKRSLWALASLRPSELAVIEEQLDSEELGHSLLADDHSLPLGCKQHRLQLLRSWLLYFTTTVHGYFMSRVVHTTELELKDKLEKSSDLDQILAVHQSYLERIYDRCFLHPSASLLYEAVNLVLTTGLEMHQLVTQSLPLHTHTLTNWEERYAKCHKFLASTLRAMTAKRKLPHLEGLVVALLHSCPA